MVSQRYITDGKGLLGATLINIMESSLLSAITFRQRFHEVALTAIPASEAEHFFETRLPSKLQSISI